MKGIIHTSKPYIKAIFIISIILLVTRELLAITKQTNWTELLIILDTLPIPVLFLLLIIGFASVSVLLAYDFILNRMIGSNYSKIYILKSSWIINSFNNLIGFGGIIGSGLRASFFSDHESTKKNVHKNIASILFFALSGLSILAFIHLCILLFVVDNSHVTNYWPWLLGGSLYFPIMMLVIRMQAWLNHVTLKIQMKLTLTSFFEWTGALFSFLAVGYALSVDMPLSEVMILFIVGTIFGVISLLPGGLGSFDVLMIISLNQLGISHEIVISWLLIYRLIYFFIPFIVGTILFAGDLGTQINKRFSGFPKQLVEFFSLKVLTIMLTISGILFMLSNTLSIHISDWYLSNYFPVSTHFLFLLTSIVLSFLLLFAARASALQLKKAYWPTIILLIIATLFAIKQDYHWLTIIYFSIVVICAFLSKKRYKKLSFSYSWEAILIDVSIYGALIFSFLFVRLLDNRFPLKHINPEFYLFPSEKQWFYGVLTIVVVLFAELILIRYLRGPSQTVIFEEQRIQRILKTYGGNETSHLLFTRDKQLYFYMHDDEDVVCIQYKRIADKCIVMGNPIGDKSSFFMALRKFKSDMAQRNYKTVYYQVSKSIVMQLHEIGFDFIKIGEAARVYLPEYSLTGKRNKALRANFNKLEKEGHTFEVIAPPHQDLLLMELKHISDEWLNGRVEKGYSVGSFDTYYLNKSPLAIVKGPNKQIEAFASLMPTYTAQAISIDLMRHRKQLASGVMDFLFLHMFQYYQEQGMDYINLGMAPFSEVGLSRDSFLSERFAYYLFQYGNKFYSFKGLRSYKEKFTKYWEPRYTVYPKDSSLIFIMLQLLLLINSEK